MNRIIVNFLILFIGAYHIGYSQVPIIENPEQYQEQAYIHYNSNFLMPGERLFYRLYIQNKSDSKATNLSKIGRVILIDSNNKMVLNHLLNLENGSAYSDFLIPSDIKTGTYKLIGYTRWMENYGNLGVYESDIYILNPFNTKIDFKKSSNQIQNQTFHKNRQLQTGIELKLSKDQFAPRTKGVLTINGIEAESLNRVSVSIRQKDNSTLNVSKNFNSIRDNNSKINFSFKNSPEYRGRTFSGRILDSSGNRANERYKIFYSVPGRTDQFRVFQSEEDGSFNFQIASPIDYSEIFLTASSRNLNNPMITLDTLKYNFEGIERGQLDFSALNPKTLRDKAIHIQIENYFKEVKKDSILPVKPRPIFYGNNPIIYNLDDYTRFETMDETFTEIIQFVSFRSKRKSPRLVIQDYSAQNTLEGIPLVLLDGQPINAHEKIFNLDPETVSEIRIIRDKYFYGPSFYQGVVDIRSKGTPEVVFPLQNSYKVQPAELQKLYFHPNYETSENSNVPDFRYQLLWIPELENSKIEFYTSDITGNFDIRLEGFDENGKFFSVSKSFEVVE